MSGKQLENNEISLAFAAYSNDLCAVKRLLKIDRTDLNSKDEHGMTALAWAVINNNLDIIKELINAKADLNIRNTMNKTILYLAMLRSDGKAIIEELIKAGVDIFEDKLPSNKNMDIIEHARNNKNFYRLLTKISIFTETTTPKPLELFGNDRLFDINLLGEVRKFLK